MSLHGACICRAYSYVLDYQALPVVYACHCLDCQTMSGGGFALQAMVPESRYSASGQTIGWTRASSLGTPTTQNFCATCLTRMASANSARLGAVLVRAGTLDRSGEIVPAFHIWTRRRQPWTNSRPEPKPIRRRFRRIAAPSSWRPTSPERAGLLAAPRRLA